MKDNEGRVAQDDQEQYKIPLQKFKEVNNFEASYEYTTGNHVSEKKKEKK